VYEDSDYCTHPLADALYLLTYSLTRSLTHTLGQRSSHTHTHTYPFPTAAARCCHLHCYDHLTLPNFDQLCRSDIRAHTPQGNLGTRDSTTQPYCGLMNMGATCYVNSLLQFLFLLPGFYTSLVRFVHRSRASDPICTRLRDLLVWMAHSNRKYISTEDLVRDMAVPVDVEQDVHELSVCGCR